MYLKSPIIFSICFAFTLSINSCTEHANLDNNDMFSFNDNAFTRWSSPENRNGVVGTGGKENNSAKGHPYDAIKPGEDYTLLETNGPGIIERMWITIVDRSPEMLRSLRLDMYWDGSSKPAVSVPFGDFFSVSLGKTIAFQNALFANPEGRSFVSFIKMPFKKSAKIVITNESTKELKDIFFDVDYNLQNNWNDNWMYFHAYWYRDTATQLGKDFELLPNIEGKGRFLGVNVGVNANPLYGQSWYGEGEVKVFLDGDKDYPTLNGTGTEDYVSTAWGEGKFISEFSGCPVCNDTTLEYSFYRYHVPDPIWFKKNCKVVLQQLGGGERDSVRSYQLAGAPLIPVTTDTGRIIYHYEQKQIIQLDSTLPKGWTNFYRSDDVCATAYYYLDKPEDKMPALQPVAMRIAKLKH